MAGRAIFSQFFLVNIGVAAPAIRSNLGKVGQRVATDTVQIGMSAAQFQAGNSVVKFYGLPALGSVADLAVPLQLLVRI